MQDEKQGKGSGWFRTSIFPTRISLATDGSEDAQSAARTATDLASGIDYELHVVTMGPHTRAARLCKGISIGMCGTRPWRRNETRVIANVGGRVAAAGAGTKVAAYGQFG